MEKIKQFFMPLLLMLIVSLGISPHSMGQGSEILSTPGTYTWVKPPGVTNLTVKIWGAGGGGGNFAGTDGQGGGGGGAFHKVSFTKTGPFTYVSVDVGQGGAAGLAGSSSDFSGLFSAAGGNGSNSGNGFGGEVAFFT